MAGNLRFEALKAAVKEGTIDTVLTCFPDMQGRLMGETLPRRKLCRNLVQRNSLLQLPCSPPI